MSRNGRVDNIILNFWELWENQTFTFNGILPCDKHFAFFEINKDFNLHLKVLEHNIVTNENIESIRQYLVKKTHGLKRRGKYKGIVEYYKQGSDVLFEWDLKLLNFVNNTMDMFPVIEDVISNCLKKIK